VKVSGVVVEDAEETRVEAAKTVVGVAVVDVVFTWAGTETVPPTSQVCSGVKLGGEQGVLLRNPSLFRVKHWFPGPTPLLTAFRTKGNPILPEWLVVELKKNCWSSVVPPSPAARPPVGIINKSLTRIVVRLTTSEKTRTSTVVYVTSSVDTGELLTGDDERPATVCHIIVYTLLYRNVRMAMH
jgi:hypothetical protein